VFSFYFDKDKWYIMHFLSLWRLVSPCEYAVKEG